MTYKIYIVFVAQKIFRSLSSSSTTSSSDTESDKIKKKNKSRYEISFFRIFSSPYTQYISRKKKLKKKKRKKKKGKKDTVKDKDLTQSDIKEESANPKPKKVLDFLFI